MSEDSNDGTRSQTDKTGAQRRSETHVPATDSKEATLGPSHNIFFANFRFSDIFSARHHTYDFMDSRAEYITMRLRFMAFFFAVATPLYIPVDYYTLTTEHFIPIVIVRCILTLIHIIVILITFRKLGIMGTNILLGADILAATLFSVSSLYILQSGVSEVPPVGYAFMPFMIIVMLGLFPLTLVCSLLIMTLLVVGPYIGFQIWLEQLFTRESLDMLFLFLLFMGIVLWLQSGQLLMLLKLYRESTRDVLTDLINRRVLMKFLDDEADENSKKTVATSPS